MSQANYDFLLRTYQPSQIDNIISDIEKFQKGYTPLYVVDTYDVVEYYLPFTQGNLFERADRNIQAQKFICYDQFFGKLSSEGQILMDEYKVEILAAKNKISKSLKEVKTVYENLETLKKNSNNFIDSPDKYEDFFNKHFEVLLLILLLNEKSFNVLEDFFEFVRNRLLISEIKVLQSSDQLEVNFAFKQNTQSSSTVPIFKAYIDQNKTVLLTLGDKDERHIFLENTFRDIQVIDRVRMVNKFFRSKEMKYFVIYLSSAHKTVDIFNCMKSNKNVDGEIDFHRNIYQYFLYKKILSEFSKDNEKGIEILRSIKALLEKISTGMNTEQDGQDELFQFIQKMFADDASSLDNHFYFNVYDLYRDTFMKMQDQKFDSLIDKNELRKIIQEVDDKRNQISNMELSISRLDFKLSQLNQTYEIAETFKDLDQYEPEYRYGKDIIRNPYQHLPILILVGDKFELSLKTKIYKFININIELSDSNKVELKNLLRDVVGELANFSTKSVSKKLLKAFLVTYINLIAQNKLHSEESIILDFEKQLEIAKYQNAELDLRSTNESGIVKLKFGSTDIDFEVGYILLWLYRRNNREDEAMTLGQNLIKFKPNDPRISQGLSLCYISKAYKLLALESLEHSNIVSNCFDIALRYLKISRDKFRLLLNNDNDNAYSAIILKTYVAVLNSLADVSIRKYELNKCSDRSLISSAREYIEEIKGHFDSINLIYNEHPTYLGTEVDITFYEASNYYDNGQTSLAHEKIIIAALKLNHLRSLPVSAIVVDKIFENKHSRVNKLADQIFRHIRN